MNLTPEQAHNFLAKIEKICKDYGVYSDVNLKSKPELEHINIVINAKVGRKAN